jgi:hypothetical protein
VRRRTHRHRQHPELQRPRPRLPAHRLATRRPPTRHQPAHARRTSAGRAPGTTPHPRRRVTAACSAADPGVTLTLWDQCAHTTTDQPRHDQPSPRQVRASSHPDSGADRWERGACSAGARPNTAEVAMPKAMRVCPTAGCPELVSSGYCDTCQPARERARGTRQQRGYDARHDRLRRQWAPKVEAGLTRCSRCALPILPGAEWALDHTDDRAGYLGPSHRRCNDSAGGRAAHGG